MQPRYQIFVSSTFRDLKAERQAVLDAILEMNHFPAVMEVFRASGINNPELLAKLVNLQQRFDEVISENKQLKEKLSDVAVQGIAQGKHPVKFSLICLAEQGRIPAEIISTWDEVFFTLGEGLLGEKDEEWVNVDLCDFLEEKFFTVDGHKIKKEWKVDGKQNQERIVAFEPDVSAVLRQFLALKLVNFSHRKKEMFAAKSFKTVTCWQLTQKGQDKYLAHVAFRPPNEKPSSRLPSSESSSSL